MLFEGKSNFRTEQCIIQSLSNHMPIKSGLQKKKKKGPGGLFMYIQEFVDWTCGLSAPKRTNCTCTRQVNWMLVSCSVYFNIYLFWRCSGKYNKQSRSCCQKLTSCFAVHSGMCPHTCPVLQVGLLIHQKAWIGLSLHYISPLDMYISENRQLPL